MLFSTEPNVLHVALGASVVAVGGILLLLKRRRSQMRLQKAQSLLVKSSANKRVDFDLPTSALKGIVGSAAQRGASSVCVKCQESVLDIRCQTTDGDEQLDPPNVGNVSQFIEFIFRLTDAKGSTYSPSPRERRTHLDLRNLGFHPDVESLEMSYFSLHDVSPNEVMVVNLKYKQASIGRKTQEAIAA